MGFINNPTPATPPVVLPANQVAFGNGTGVTSSAKFTYQTSGNQITMADTARGGTITLDNQFDHITAILDTTSNSVAKLHLKDNTNGVQVWSSITTGASTASFTAANKPGGSNVTTPDKWLKVVELNTFNVYWIPLFLN